MNPETYTYGLHGHRTPVRQHCATVGCQATATQQITYTMRGEWLSDAVCADCADSYARRPALANLERRDLAGAVDGKVVTP